MKRLAIVLLCGVLIGCRGPKGDTGPQGMQGPQGASGAGKIEIISGSVTSDYIKITDSRIKTSSYVSVFVGAGGAYAELPYLLPDYNIQVASIISNGVVEIYNAKFASAVYYQVIILTPTAAPMPSGQFGDRLLW